MTRPVCEKPPILDIKFIPYSLQDWLRRLLGLINYDSGLIDGIPDNSDNIIASQVFHQKQPTSVFVSPISASDSQLLLAGREFNKRIPEFIDKTDSQTVLISQVFGG